MKRLVILRKSGERTVTPINVTIAQDFRSRTKGLLGRESIPDDYMLWFPYTSLIHTFGMKFAIDCLFVNRHFVVIDVKQNVQPNRIVGVFRFPTHVGELRAFGTRDLGIGLGDRIYLEEP